MVEAILIIAVSLALFVYWFRYTVLLLLTEESNEEPGSAAGQLPLLESREALRAANGDGALERLHLALEKDYRMLRYLLDHAAGLGLRPIERFLLMLDYRMLQICYRATRTSSTERARRALEEMAEILGYISHRMGEQAGNPSRA